MTRLEKLWMAYFNTLGEWLRLEVWLIEDSFQWALVNGWSLG